MREVFNDILLLTVVFVGLKAGGQIDWDWIWVFSPIWLGIAFHLGVIAVGLMLIGLGSFAKEKTK